MARTWGFWTRSKLEILSSYLPALTRASSKKAQATAVYLDLFAGTPEGTERDTGEPIPNSVERALNTIPRFTRHYFFELPAVASDLKNELALRHPGRDDYRVVAGDSNETIDRVLSELRESRLDWAPTFAFLDPRNLGAKRTTIEKLADFKRGRRNKIELWVLCFSSAIPRVLGGEGDVPVGAEQVTAFYGTDQWQVVKEGRDQNLLSPGEAREETDNETGSRIMRDIDSRAAKEHSAMRREAAERRKVKRHEERGRPSLFHPEEFAAGAPAEDVRYMHEPPWAPYGLSGGGPSPRP